MAAVLISVLFSPFFYGLEIFLASTLTTQVALSVATVVVSTATIFYCQRALYQWYLGTTEFIVRIKNKVGLSERHVTFSAKGHKIEQQGETTEDDTIITERKSRTGESVVSTSKEVTTSGKTDIPLDSWLQKQTVAMHRSHWVAKPGRIAPTTFIGFGRRGSSDSIPTITRGKAPPSTSDDLPEQQTKLTLDRRQSSPSSFGIPRTKRTHTGILERTSGVEEIESYVTVTSVASQESHHAGTSSPGTPSIALSEVKEQTSKPSESKEISRDPPSLDRSSSDDVALAQDETPQVKLVPTETVVREALLVDSSSSAPSLHANIQSLPVDSSESDRQTSEERSSGHTDTDSLATDDIFSDSELDDSKRSDDVFLHDDADPLPITVPPRDIFVDRCSRTESSPKGPQPDIIVCESDITARASNDNIEGEPDSSVSLSVEGGPVPRKDSFGLLPVLKCRVQHVRIESTSYTGPVTAISIEEAKSESDSEMSEKSGRTDRKNGSDPPKRVTPPPPQKQDSLGVPPVVTGEVSFPGAISKPIEKGPTSRTKVPISKMSKVDSLEVPPMLKVEDSLPPYPTKVVESKQQQNKPIMYKEIKVRLPPKRHGRPNSLDIPSLNVSETCPPRRDFNEKRTFPMSSTSIFRVPSELRKQGPSILKRSGSVDRTGPKKSVTFSPIVIPWGGSSEEGIEPSGERSDLKRPSGSSSPVRPKVIRYHSVDVPDTMRRRQRTEFIRQLGLHGEFSDEDQEILEEERLTRFLQKYTQMEDKKGTKRPRKRAGIDEGPIKTDLIKRADLAGAIRKSAKERFLEAGGARAVMSVLVTQDSSDKGSQSLSSSSGGKDSPTSQTAEDDATTSWAKYRFLMSGDGNFCRASRFFVERVKGSVDLAESQSDHSSPSDTNEDTSSSSSSDQQFEETEEGGIRSTSAKSRFLWSCRENMSSSLMASGSLPADRLFALWEPIPLILQGLPEADETNEDTASGVTQRSADKKQSASELTTSDIAKGTTQDDIDSPESSGVHSMDPDEAVSEGLISLGRDSKTKHVPSNSSCTSLSSSRTRHLKTSIVVDNGSQFIKVGLIDEKKPSIEIPNVISRDRVQSFNSRFVGLDAVKNCSISPFQYPIIGGLVQNWEDVESIWKHVFDDKLGLLPKEHPLLMTEIATVPKQQREKAMEILFETFNAPAIYFSNQASLSLRATGRTTGLALSSGSGVTEVVPVHNGTTLTRAVTKLDLGGRSATKYMAHLIEKDTGHRLMTSPGALEVLRELKEDQTYVNKVTPKSPTSDEYGDTPWNCWLPDGTTVEAKREHVHACAEPLFQPALAGILHQPGMPNLVADCLDRCDQNALSEFPSSLLLCGGNTYLGGLTERLQAELNTLGLGYITVEAPKGRDLLPWVGGAMLAAQLDSENQWLASEEYAEHGGSIVHKRCT